MKKTLLILTALMLFNLPSFAEITTDEAVSESYIRNHGYSEDMAKLINLQNSQINGTPFNYKNKQPDWYTSNKAVKFVRGVFIYLDPAMDDDSFMRHDIRITPKYDDL